MKTPAILVGILSLLALLGCKSVGSACVNGYTSSCDDNDVVYCKIEAGAYGLGKGKIVREPCEKKCVSSMGSAACVEDDQVCDPKTFAASCGKDAKGEFSIICAQAGTDKFYPSRKDLSCEDKGMSCFNPSPAAAICVQDKTACDPETFKPRCLNETQASACVSPENLDVYGVNAKGYPVARECDPGTACSARPEDGIEGCYPR